MFVCKCVRFFYVFQWKEWYITSAVIVIPSTHKQTSSLEHRLTRVNILLRAFLSNFSRSQPGRQSHRQKDSLPCSFRSIIITYKHIIITTIAATSMFSGDGGGKREYLLNGRIQHYFRRHQTDIATILTI